MPLRIARATADRRLHHDLRIAIAREERRDTLRRILPRLDELAEPGTIGFGFHFGDQAFGRTVVDTAGETIWEPVPSSILAPAPRLSR